MRIGLAGAGRIGAFHAQTLTSLTRSDGTPVDEVLVADIDPARAHAVAAQVGPGVRAVGSVAELIAAQPDGLVIATATDTHTELILAGAEAGIPTFCEKPVAADAAGTRAVLEKLAGAPVQIGFQRHFDAGYRAARAAVASGELGWVHTMRAGTLDPAPPHREYIPSSGGFFRDCSVHDFDAVRWVSGQEVQEVYARGANRGADFFREYGDIDTAAALLTLTDGTFAHVMGSRYNAAGYDVRLEVLGSAGGVSVGMDDGLPLRSAEPGVTFPSGPAYPAFMQRFHDAYVAELTAFVESIAAPVADLPGVADALSAILVAEACELSRQLHRPVTVEEVSS